MDLEKAAEHVNAVWHDEVIRVIDEHTVCLAPYEQAITVRVENGIIVFPATTKFNFDILEILVAFMKGVKDGILR